MKKEIFSWFVQHKIPACTPPPHKYTRGVAAEEHPEIQSAIL